MKKLLMMTAAALLLVACGDGTKNTVENKSGTKMGEVLSKVKALAKDQADLENKIMEAKDEVAKEYDKKSEGKSKRETLDMVDDYMKDVNEATKGYKEELDKFGEKWDALADELEGTEIPTEVADGTPLKIKEPVHLKDIVFDSPTVKVIFEAEAQTTVGVAQIQKVGADYGNIIVEGYTKDGVAIEQKMWGHPHVESNGEVEFEFELSRAFRDIAQDNCQWFDEWMDVEKIVISWEGASVTDASGQPTGYIGELGLFELKGKVKQCTWNYDGTKIVRTFDENGFWKTNDGQALSAIYTSGIKRDSQKRIVQGLMDTDNNGEDYAYNSDGSKKSYCYHYFDDVSNETYKYDDKGNMTSVVSSDMDGEWKTTYVDVKYDDHGNWTERKAKNQEGGTSVEKRTIVYY